jgi:hypothetical protein
VKAFSFEDPFHTGCPFLYFAAHGGKEAYTPDCLPVTSTQDKAMQVKPYLDSQSPIRYLNPNSFQIVSAGPDGRFGPGGYWLPGNPGSVTGYKPGEPGHDDVANFHPTASGKPAK